jgi:hypothetical protein
MIVFVSALHTQHAEIQKDRYKLLIFNCPIFSWYWQGVLAGNYFITNKLQCLQPTWHLIL